MVQARITAVVVGQEVVVVGGVLTAPQAAITVLALAMDRVSQTLREAK